MKGELMMQSINLKIKNKSVGNKVPDHIHEIYDIQSDAVEEIKDEILEEPIESKPKRKYKPRRAKMKPEEDNETSSGE